MPLRAGARRPAMKRIYRRCCGIDVHKATLSACVRVRRHGQLIEEVRNFGTTSDELLALRDWLSSHRVTHVAMEATGVYWKPVYYVLEDGFSVLLVNPAHVKRMPGRKTDISDCAWLAQLLEYGLLEPSFVPPPAIRELRDLVRHRTELKHDHTRIANRLHKVLQDADLKLSSVMTDILGVSGRQILSSSPPVTPTLRHWPSWPAAVCGPSCRRCAKLSPAAAASITPSWSAICWPTSTIWKNR
jgi:transposase